MCTGNDEGAYLVPYAFFIVICSFFNRFSPCKNLCFIVIFSYTGTTTPLPPNSSCSSVQIYTFLETVLDTFALLPKVISLLGEAKQHSADPGDLALIVLVFGKKLYSL